MRVEEYRKYINRERRSKYNAKRCMVTRDLVLVEILSKKEVEKGDIYFDSKGEARRYIDLKMLERFGKIKNLKLQVPHTLLEGFIYENKKYTDIVYVSDFEYDLIDEKVHVVEDKKGYRTDVYRMKKKMLLNVFRQKGLNYKFIES